MLELKSGTSVSKKHFHRIVIAALIVMTLASAQRPPDRMWELFSKTRFTEKLNRKFGQYFYYPNFPEELKKLEGQPVELQGFFIPLEMGNVNTLILSKYPMAECFFCGGSGPESVAVAYLKSKPTQKLKMDQIIKVRGTLQLNAEDVEEMTFILKNAEIIK